MDAQVTETIATFVSESAFYLDCLAVLVAFIYITKVCFVGKCSVIKIILMVLLCIVINPVVALFVGIFFLDFMPVNPLLYLLRDSRIGVAFDTFTAQIVALVVFGLIYAAFCRKEKRAIGVFSYMMLYMLAIFGMSISSCAEGLGVPILIICLLVVVAIFVLFFRFLVPEIVQFSKNKQEERKTIFYLLPTAYVFVASFLVTLLLNEKLSLETQITILIVVAFMEFLMIVTFHYILKNLAQINEIKTQNTKLEIAKNDIKTLSVEVMEALAHTIDAKDEYTRGHSIRVAQYSRMIAKKLGLNEEECENIYYMGLLDDIRKIGVPNSIINSPSKLTDEEYRVIKTHPGLGYGILSEIKSRPDLAIGARWHHERFDGRGYPDEKSGEDIPLMARIIAVADSYDAMTSTRSYRDYMSQEKVRSEIEKNAGTQFDPEIAKCMLAIIDEDTEYTLHE